MFSLDCINKNIRLSPNITTSSNQNIITFPDLKHNLMVDFASLLVFDGSQMQVKNNNQIIRKKQQQNKQQQKTNKKRKNTCTYIHTYIPGYIHAHIKIIMNC